MRLGAKIALGSSRLGFLPDWPAQDAYTRRIECDQSDAFEPLPKNYLRNHDTVYNILPILDHYRNMIPHLQDGCVTSDREGMITLPSGEKNMSEIGKKWGTVSLDSDGENATVFLEESIPGEGPTPEQSIIGHCAWKDRSRVESIVNSFLKTKSYPTHRSMTEAEVEEVRQTVRQKGY